jgi:acyl phosphate:glycerol-3-phosphate acyltransferase
VLTLAFAVCAYFLGAVPFGLLLGKWRGKDIREHGSRNIGATNAGRVLGRKWGILCLLLDVLKGLVPTALAGHFLVDDEESAAAMGRWLLVGVAAVLGHTFPVWLGFRGGKGVATTIGVALGVFPHLTIAMAAALVLYAIARFGTGIVSIGSLALAVTFPLAFFVYLHFRGLPLAVYWPLGAVAGGLGSLIIVLHRANIRRLLRGEEFAARGAPPTSSSP